jgi:phage-related minor tail protein
MKNKMIVFLSLILAFSFSAFAQTKTVTNADLEKFRQKRLQAEREYRENYERLGFPSPEELEKKRIEDEQKLIEYSRQLEAQRLEREAAQAEAENRALWLQNQYLQSQINDSNYNPGVYYSGGYLPFYNGYYKRPLRRSGFYKNKNGFNDPYPWMISPAFRRQRFLSTQPSRFLPRTKNPRIKTRTGRGRN